MRSRIQKVGHGAGAAFTPRTHCPRSALGHKATGAAPLTVGGRNSAITAEYLALYSFPPYRTSVAVQPQKIPSGPKIGPGVVGSTPSREPSGGRRCCAEATRSFH